MLMFIARFLNNYLSEEKMADEYFTPSLIKQLRSLMIVPGTKLPVSLIMETLGNPESSYDSLVKKNPALKKISQDEIFLNTAKALKLVEGFLKKQKEKYIEEQMTKAGLPPEKEKKTKAAAEKSGAPQQQKPKFDFTINGDVRKAKEAKIYIDACCRGNPGESSVAVIIKDFSDNKLFCESKPVGNMTNNAAEYNGLINALEHALKFGIKKAYVFSDSKLVVNQVSGIFKIKNENIAQLAARAQQLKKQFDKFQIVHVPRENNQEADWLANQALKKEK